MGDAAALEKRFNTGPLALPSAFLAEIVAGTVERAPEAAAIPGAWLVALLSDAEARRELPLQGLIFRGVAIDGPVDLAYLEIGLPLRFLGCTFRGVLNISGAKLKALDLTGSTLPRLDGASVVIQADLVADGVTCGPADLEDCEIKGDASFLGARLRAGTLPQVARMAERGTNLNLPWPLMPRDAALSFDRASIGARLSLAARGLMPGESAENVERLRFAAEGCVYLRGCKVGGAIDGRGGAFLGGMSEDGAFSTGAIRAQACTAGGPVFLGPCDAAHGFAPFEAVGCVDFSEAKLAVVFVGPANVSAERALGQAASLPDEDADTFTDRRTRARRAAAYQRYTAFRAAERKDHLDDDDAPSLKLTSAVISGEISVVGAQFASYLHATNARVATNLTIKLSCFGTRGHVDTIHSLYLDGAQIADTIFVIGSQFHGEVGLIGASVGGEIDISHSMFRAGRRDRGEGQTANCRSLAVGKMAVSGSDFVGRLNLTDLQVRNGADFERVTAVFHPKDVEDRALLDLSGARLGGRLVFNGCTLGKRRSRPHCALLVNAAKINGSVILSRRDPAAASERSRFYGEVAVCYSELGGYLVARDGYFRSDGRAALALSGTAIKGNLNLKGSRLEIEPPPADAEDWQWRVATLQETQIGGSAILADATFRGTVDLTAIRVRGALNAKGALFRFPGDAATRDAVGDGYHALLLARGEIGGDFLWYGAPPAGPRRSSPGWWRQRFALMRAEIDDMLGLETGGAAPDQPEGVLNLQAARVGRLFDSDRWWPRRTDRWCLRLDGFVYDRIVEDPLQIRRGWLEGQDPERFSLQPYEHLARVLRTSGQAARADRVALAKQRAIRTHRIYTRRIRRVVREKGRCSSAEARSCMQSSRRTQNLTLWAFWAAVWLPLLAAIAILAGPEPVLQSVSRLMGGVPDDPWLWLTLAAVLGVIALRKWEMVRNTGNYLLEVVVGNGYRPMRTAFLAGAVVVLGALMFGIGSDQGRFLPIQARNYAATDELELLKDDIAYRPDAYPQFNRWAYSIDAFLPILGGNQKALWVLRNEYTGAWPANWLEVYRVLHVLAGWILTTLIALSPVKLFRKD